MGQVVFIVWRESVEALLVVGILYAWLRANPEAAAGRRYLWGGVVAGLLLSFVLAGALLAFAEAFEGERQDYFQLGMVMVAAVLIVQMVFWMKKHARTLKRDLEHGLSQRVATANWWGMLVVVALAIARECSETVVFLYGLGAAQQGADLPMFIGSALVGLAAAFATFLLLQAGTKIFSWRTFFRVTEVMLLLLAGALMVTGVEKMMSLGWLPGLVDPLWDTSWLLDDNGKIGGLLAALTGYRAQPALTTLLALGLYWVLICWGLRRTGAVPATTQPRAA